GGCGGVGKERTDGSIIFCSLPRFGRDWGASILCRNRESLLCSIYSGGDLGCSARRSPQRPAQRVCWSLAEAMVPSCTRTLPLAVCDDQIRILSPSFTMTTSSTTFSSEANTWRNDSLSGATRLASTIR